MRRYRIIVSSAFVLCLAAFLAIGALTALRADDDEEPYDALLPTACENFVDATELLAEHGSAAGIEMSGGDPFSGDPAARSRETLELLLAACDAELATMAR